MSEDDKRKLAERLVGYMMDEDVSALRDDEARGRMVQRIAGAFTLVASSADDEREACADALLAMKRACCSSPTSEVARTLDAAILEIKKRGLNRNA